ncbi:MAG: Stp1/IreP family PP2C-type Ser/Thr phosphatase [Candidatus Hydrogenedentes bacterium]|nr:Stp1/IreP family PP2C-type Ser/Thr phosphatase [Candidatus Hydrogenedentota bacterium]
MASIPLTRSGPEDGGYFEHQWAGGYLQVHLISDVGKKRTRNEDCCLLCAPEDRVTAERRGTMVAVADGMGGVSGGAFASKLALQTIADAYYNGSEPTIPARLHEAVVRANRRIYEEAESHPEYYGMGTTVSATQFAGQYAYIAQVGDSRVYLLRDGTNIWQITEDHSLVAEQVRNGFLSEEQARTHSLRNLITRAVGTKENVKVDLFSLELKQGDTLMICSDGLSGLVEDTQIAKSLCTDNLQGAARALVGRALEGGGSDNITVAIVRVAAAPPPAQLEPGAVAVRLTRPGFLGKLRKLFS